LTASLEEVVVVSKNTLTSLAGLALVLSTWPALAQQLPDRDYRPPVENPTWPTGEGPTVCLDEAHNNFHTLENRFWAFGELLRRDGYVVVPNTESLSVAGLARCDVLVISNAQLPDGGWATYPYPTPAGFTPAEVGAAYDWVRMGRSLLLIADHMPLAGVAATLAAGFGVTFNNGFAFENVDPETGQPGGPPTVFSTEDGTLRPHAIVSGRTPSESVTRVHTFTGQAFQAPDSAAPLLILPESFVSLMPARAWEFGPETKQVPGGGWLQGTAMTVGSGRAVFFGEAAMFSAQVSGPSRSPGGMNAPMAEQNFQFVLNILHWLTGELD
jgi:hypothetical protein